jgi:hypothetical protein
MSTREKSGCPGEGTLEKCFASQRVSFLPDNTAWDRLAQVIQRDIDPALFNSAVEQLNSAAREQLERRARIWSRALEERLAYLKGHDRNAYAKLLMRFCNMMGPLAGLWQRLDGFLDQESGLQAWNMASSGPPIRPEIQKAVLEKLREAGFTGETAWEALNGLSDQSGSVDEIIKRILFSRADGCGMPRFTPATYWQPIPEGVVVPCSKAFFQHNRQTGLVEVRWDDPVPRLEEVIYKEGYNAQAKKSLERTAADDLNLRRRIREAMDQGAAATPPQPEKANSAFSTNSTDPLSREKAGKEKGNYPPVDWDGLEKAATQNGARFTQETVYPQNSILAPYMALARTVCESADTHLLGAVLPVAGAMLARRVYIGWPQGNIYPNLFSLLIGPAGQRKTDAVKLASRIARAHLPDEAFLKKHLSPEALFEEYWIGSGGSPDKLLLIHEANIILASWSRTDHGARVAAEFLDLYDCGPLSEAFMRNKGKNTGAGRTISETSTNVVMAGTFNVAMFPVAQIRQGIQRRFIFNVAETLGRTIQWPEDVPLGQVIQAFKPLLGFKGEIKMPKKGEAWDFWVDYQAGNRALLNQTGLDNESLSARLATTPTSVLKVAMIFEACMAAQAKTPLPRFFGEISLKRAADYVAAHMKGAEFIDRYGTRKVAQERAEVILAIIRREFKPDRRPDTIYVTRSDLTRRFCPNTGRNGAISVDDLYLLILPELERQGEATQVLKRGKLEVYAFRTEF